MSKKNQATNDIEVTRGFKVSIYVPSTFAVGERISKRHFDKSAQAVEMAFTRRFGGATSVLGHGSYQANNGELVSEPVWIVSVFIDHSPTQDDANFFRGILNAVKLMLQQESVTLTCEAIEYCFI